MPSDDAKWHQDKKKEIVAKMPDVTSWDGAYRLSFVLVAVLVLVQWGLWYFVHHNVNNIFLIGVSMFIDHLHTHQTPPHLDVHGSSTITYFLLQCGAFLFVREDLGAVSASMFFVWKGTP
jgi:hypothetical protein